MSSKRQQSLEKKRRRNSPQVQTFHLVSTGRQRRKNLNQKQFQKVFLKISLCFIVAVLPHALQYQILCRLVSPQVVAKMFSLCSWRSYQLGLSYIAFTKFVLAPSSNPPERYFAFLELFDCLNSSRDRLRVNVNCTAQINEQRFDLTCRHRQRDRVCFFQRVARGYVRLGGTRFCCAPDSKNRKRHLASQL